MSCQLDQNHFINLPTEADIFFSAEPYCRSLQAELVTIRKVKILKKQRKQLLCYQ